MFRGQSLNFVVFVRRHPARLLTKVEPPSFKDKHKRGLCPKNPPALGLVRGDLFGRRSWVRDDLGFRLYFKPKLFKFIRLDFADRQPGESRNQH